MAIPEIRESKRDMFNGNVIRGETILFVYLMLAVFLEDACLLSFDETNRLKIRHSWPFAAIFVFFGVVWILLFAATVIVGRNPQKFSPKIVRLFFKRRSIRK